MDSHTKIIFIAGLALNIVGSLTMASELINIVKDEAKKISIAQSSERLTKRLYSVLFIYLIYHIFSLNSDPYSDNNAEPTKPYVDVIYMEDFYEYNNIVLNIVLFVLLAPPIIIGIANIKKIWSFILNKLITLAALEDNHKSRIIMGAFILTVGYGLQIWGTAIQ